ncbi:PREDICTED: uncharacterized protein LOC105570844 [Vollenhovia emeryi]|uniref:uncharacterized protein LOC105570844 n=1 Tax=Vollenhovia emeryi TaxID=411798 RepID=UPI0005F4D0EA|nr:PREDICTED: uncharacterized protein LOC105570844 [Vollenhovia emeryi]
MADILEELTVEELVKRLEHFGLQTAGTKAALCERLRKAMEEETSQSADEQNHGEKTRTAGMTTEIRLEDLTKVQLKQRLRELKLPISGLKSVLRERLRAALQKDSSDEGDNEDDGDENEGDDGDENEGDNGEDGGNKDGVGGEMVTPHRGRDAHAAILPRNVFNGDYRDGGRRAGMLPTHNRGDGATVLPRNAVDEGYDRQRTRQVVLTYKDVEDALSTFSGDGTQSVTMWFTSFEETADLCGWTDVQKIIYAKRLLRGSAKLFANFECRVQSYRAFRRALAEEFGKTMNSRQVHKELSKVTKKSEETYQEYIYRVLELASHGEIELEAKIQYIIDGIKDEESNKAILYSATSIKELRQKFMQYETQRANRNKAKQQQQQTSLKKRTTNSSNQVATAVTAKRCFNCGDSKHLGKDCPSKVKGAKCYSCNEFGHIAAKCPKGAEATKEKTPARVDALQSHDDKKTYKTVRILEKVTGFVQDFFIIDSCSRRRDKTNEVMDRGSEITPSSGKPPLKLQEPVARTGLEVRGLCDVCNPLKKGPKAPL